jgi:hypothetical protein
MATTHVFFLCLSVLQLLVLGQQTPPFPMNGMWKGTVDDTVRPDFDYLLAVEMINCAVYAKCAIVYYEDTLGGWNCSGTWTVGGYHAKGTGYSCYNNLFPCWSLTENLDVGGCRATGAINLHQLPDGQAQYAWCGGISTSLLSLVGANETQI